VDKKDGTGAAIDEQEVTVLAGVRGRQPPLRSGGAAGPPDSQQLQLHAATAAKLKNENRICVF
jgi:hypothetical protein